MTTKISGKTFFVVGAILFVAFSRLLPHIPNFTPVAAMALFGGALLTNKKSAYLLTFAALLLSDILVNTILYNDYKFTNYLTQPFVWAVYFSFGLTVFMGTSFQHNINVKNVAFFSISSSLLFWLLTNFACWPNNPLYTQDIAGLINCYISAIPFLGNVIGDLFYNTLLFGTLFLVGKRIPVFVKA
jgi:hypothetical protein